MLESCRLSAGKVLACSLLVAAVVGLLASCAPIDAVGAWLKDEPYETDPADPFESTNRIVYRFNDILDKAFFKPVAEVYDDLTPAPAKSCVANFFSNLKEPVRFVAHSIRREGKNMIDTTMRFVVNTILGIGGCFDVAKSMNVPVIEIDIGLALLSLDSVEQSPFIMLPIFGPSTLISAGGDLVASFYLDPLKNPKDPDPRPAPENRNFFESHFGGPNPYATASTVRRRNYAILHGISVRADLLDEGEILDAAALDPYLFLRDAYLQSRKNRAEELAGQ